MQMSSSFALFATMIVMILGATNATSQSEARTTGEKAKYPNLPQHIRDPLIQMEMLREPIRRNKIDKKPVPWRGPDGEQLVGVVEDRMLTKPQLDLRTNFILQGLAPERDPIAAQDRRVLLESSLLAEWVKVATLAHHAETLGIDVPESEVRKAIAELGSAISESGGEGGGAGAGRFVGIPEAELYNEVRDSLLVEKFVQMRIRETISEQKIRELFEKAPEKFLDPTIVTAYHLFLPRQPMMLESEVKKLTRDMEKLAKALRKADRQEDFEAIRQSIEGTPFVLSLMGDVTSEDPIHPTLKQMLFVKTKPGATSDLFSTQVGYHVVKVLTRTEGEAMTLDNARDMIEAELFTQYRDMLFEGIPPREGEPGRNGIKSNYKIYSSAGGLNKWIPVAPYPEPQVPETPAVSLRDQAVARKLRKGGYDLTPPPMEDVLIFNAEKRLQETEAQSSPPTAAP